MTRFVNRLVWAVLLLAVSAACDRDDFGPYEELEQTYGLTDFDRLAMGSALRISVQQGAAFGVTVRGNRRDVEDLELTVRNNTLNARYRNWNRSRRYDTYVTVTMPTLRGVDFSGASKSTVAGFTSLRELDVTLSGASKSELAVQADRLNLDVSGASKLDLTGRAGTLRGDVSGASKLYAFPFPVNEADLDVSGASKAELTVATALFVEASGASDVRYRGNPTVQQRTTGASTVKKD